MKITEQNIHSVGTNGIGFNFHQLYVLGVKWPPSKGWIRELVGKEISDYAWELVVKLKDKGRNERREILKDTPFHHEIFVRKCDLKQRVNELSVELYELRDRISKADRTLERLGYRHCDIAACNCNGYHKTTP